MTTTQAVYSMWVLQGRTKGKGRRLGGNKKQWEMSEKLKRKTKLQQSHQSPQAMLC